MTDLTGAVSMDSLIKITATAGSLVGRRCGQVAAFKGIPYAVPPVGSLRWRPTQRAPRWEGTRSALDFGPAPIQELPPRSSLLYRLNNDDAHALVMSEDCLYLNVWTPEPSPMAKLPVLFWVHGGGNKMGHGGQDLFDGARLAARGIVVVTVNMRLGALGFLSLPGLAEEDELGASGNYGLQDVVSALGWVQDNIAAFGGDAARVTIAGNSSGSAIVSHLMATSAARGMFGAAIGQSASGLFRHEGRHLVTHAEVAERGQAAVASLGKSLKQLRDLPAMAFLRIQPQGVIVDGRVLTEDSTDVFLQGRQAAVPLLAGWNADEGSLYATSDALAALNVGNYPETSQATLAQIYPGVSSPEGWASRRALVGDRRFTYPVWRWARTHADTTGSPTWAYEFNHQLPLPVDLPPPPDGGEGYGCFHTAELPYTWDNLAARPWGWRERDHEMARCLADTWVRFITHGDPSGGELPTWQSLNVGGDKPLMVFDAVIHASRPKHLKAFEVFDQMYFGSTQ